MLEISKSNIPKIIIIKQKLNWVLFSERIYGKGFGETTPNIPSPNGCGTLSEDEHQLNRRTEFIIVELGGANTRD